MKRMSTWACLGAALGFIAFAILFPVAAPDNGERALWIVFAIMGAVPVAVMAALFGAVGAIQEELRETRREFKHWQSMQMYDEPEKPSTNIKPAPPSGRP